MNMQPALDWLKMIKPDQQPHTCIPWFAASGPPVLFQNAGAL